MDSPEMQKVVIEMLKAAQLKNETTVPKKTAKKPYSPPRLVVCGKLSDITGSVGKTGALDGSGNINANKTRT
jgi:hypothetical protein